MEQFNGRAYSPEQFYAALQGVPRQTMTEQQIAALNPIKTVKEDDYMKTRTFDDRSGGLGGVLAGLGNAIVDPVRQGFGAVARAGMTGANALGNAVGGEDWRNNDFIKGVNDIYGNIWNTIDNSTDNKDNFSLVSEDPLKRWDVSRGGSDLVSDLGAVAETGLMFVPGGAAARGALAGGKTAAKLLPQVGRMAGLGAGFGAADTLRQGGMQTNLGELLGNSASGAAFGGAFPIAGRGISRAANAVSSKVPALTNRRLALGGAGVGGIVGYNALGGWSGDQSATNAPNYASSGYSQVYPTSGGSGYYADPYADYSYATDPYADMTDEELYQLVYGGY